MIGLRIGIRTGVFALVAGGVGVDSISGGATFMTLNITDDSDPVANSETLTYTATVTNTGMAPLVILALAITLDVNSTYVSSTAGGFTSIGQAAGVVTATLSGLVAPGATCACTISVTTPASAMTLSCSGIATAGNAPSATDTETTSVLVVAKDATSGKRVPTGASQWASVMSIAGITSGGPSLLWLLQETSGNLADSIGTFTGSVLPTIAYQQAEAGWTRKSIGFANQSTGEIYNQAAGLPDLASASQLLLIYANLTSTIPSGVTVFGVVGLSLQARLLRPDSNIFRVGTGVTNTDGTANPTGQMRPYVLRFDRTNLRNNGYSDQEKLSPVFETGIAGKFMAIGENGGLAPESTINYAVSFFNGAAELTDAQIKRLLQVLGWTVSW